MQRIIPDKLRLSEYQRRMILKMSVMKFHLSGLRKRLIFSLDNQPEHSALIS